MEHDRSGHRHGDEPLGIGEEGVGLDGTRAGHLHRHHGHVGAPQGCPHVGIHNAAGEVADAGAEGGPSQVCGLHPLVCARAARHLEPASLCRAPLQPATPTTLKLPSLISGNGGAISF